VERNGKGRKGKGGREQKGREGMETKWRARLGYLSGAPVPSYSTIHYLCCNTIQPDNLS